MKFGLCLPNFGGKIGTAGLLELSMTAEELGLDSVWATDHVIMPRVLKSPYDELLEPFITLSFIAARTSRLKLGTSIIVLPQRNPFLVAKQAATLDQFSRGRVMLGVGAGWVEEEFGYLGANFKQRGRVFDESIEVVRTVWREDTINYEGRFFRAKDAVSFPKPVQKAIPIWIGGTSDAAIKRAARIGDGWHPVGVDPDRLGEGARSMREAGGNKTVSLRITVDVRRKREDYVGSGSERRVTLSGTPEEISRRLDEYKRSGLEYLVAYIYQPEVKEILADVKKFSNEVLRSYS